jgi:hypothetical protein
MPASVLACENEQVFLLYFRCRYGKKIYVYLYTNTSRDQNQDSNVDTTKVLRALFLSIKGVIKRHCSYTKFHYFNILPLTQNVNLNIRMPNSFHWTF